MEQNNKKELGNHIVFDKSCDLTINENSLSSYIFEVENNCYVNILIEASKSIDIDLVVKSGASLKIALLNKENQNNFNFKGKVKKEGTFTCVIADFGASNTNINSTIDLIENYASSNFILSSTSNERFKKNYNINFNHLSEFTTSKIKAFGVSLKESEIKVNGVSFIEKTSIKSNASQEVKIILFDKTSKGSASPILKIECDDIKASHGCSIGSINDDHLYYLLSRGIDIETVRKLIVLGYILPIKDYFNDKEKEYIDNYIRKDFNYA